MTEEVSGSNDDTLQRQYAQAPENFPHQQAASGLAGLQPKLSMVEYNGKFYAPGDTPPDRYQRWQYYEEMAVIFVEKCRKNQTGKYSHLSEVEILEQYCVRLLKTGWGSDAELKWVICRTAGLLGWPIPPTAEAT